MASILLSEYKSHSGIIVTTYDTLITAKIAVAQSKAEAFCARKFDSASYTEYLNGNGTQSIVLKNTPITALTSVTLISSDNVETELDSDTYRYEAESGILRRTDGGVWARFPEDWAGLRISRFGRSNGFPQGYRNIKVVYTAGYTAAVETSTAGNAPAALKQALYYIVSMELARARKGIDHDPALTSASLGDLSLSWKGQAEVDKTWKELLLPYRRTAWA